MTGPATATFTVSFGRSGRPQTRPRTSPGRVPRVTRLLALAHKIDEMIRSGELRDLAHAAKVCAVTRARMTQISNLLLLAPGVQEEILDLPPVTRGRDPITERSLREIVAEADWERQAALWTRLLGRQTRVTCEVHGS